MAVLNPDAWAEMLYEPTGRKRRLYTPAAFVFASVVMLVLTFLAVTVAFGTTPPAGSVTVPVIEPVMVWAEP